MATCQIFLSFKLLSKFAYAQKFLLRQRTWNTKLLYLKFFSPFPKCVQMIPVSRKSVVLAHGWLRFFKQSTSLYSISLWLIFLLHFSSKNFIYLIYYWCTVLILNERLSFKISMLLIPEVLEYLGKITSKTWIFKSKEF